VLHTGIFMRERGERGRGGRGLQSVTYGDVMY
jgi:hypothetical protein